MIWCNCHQFQKTPKKIETENNIRSGQLHHHHQIINILENDDITTLFRGHSRFSTVFLELAQRMVHFLVFEIFRFHFGWPRKSVIKKSKPKNHFQNDSLFSKNQNFLKKIKKNQKFPRKTFGNQQDFARKGIRKFQRKTFGTFHHYTRKKHSKIPDFTQWKTIFPEKHYKKIFKTFHDFPRKKTFLNLQDLAKN